MKGGIAVCGTLLVASSAAWGASNPADNVTTYEGALLRPIVTIREERTKPIDGRLGAGTALSDFVGVMGDEKGVAGADPAKAYVSYDEQGLYVGFRVEMPEGAKPVVTVRDQRDKGMSDDAVEFFVTPGDRPGYDFHFGGNAGNCYWDRPVGRDSHDWAWNPEGIRYASSVDEQGWSAEFYIPYAAIGAKKPEKGTVWRMNFMSNRLTPTRRLEAWSYVDKWDDRQGGRVIFGGTDGAYFHIRDTWRHVRMEGERGMWPGIVFPVRPANQSRSYQITHALLRKDLNPEDESSFFTELTALRAQSFGEAATFKTLPEDVKSVLGKYKQAQGVFDYSKKLPDPDFSVMWPGPMRVEAPGDYVFVYYVKDVTDAEKPFVVAGGALPFRIREGIGVSAMPYFLTRRSLVATADLRAMRDTKNVSALRLTIADEKDGKTLVDVKSPFAGERRQDVEMSIKDLPVDRRYVLGVEALDKDGKAFSSAKIGFSRPADPDWWVNRDKYGASPEVPQPWTPVRWKDGVAEVWGRTITLDGALLPKQIVTQGRKLLAAPMELELKVGGRTVAWQSAQFKLVEQREGHVVFETSQEAAGLRVRGTHRLEFDGFSLIDLQLEPVNGPVAVDSLELVNRHVAAHAALVSNYMKAPGPGKAVPRVVGTTPEKLNMPAMLTMWLGDDKGGLEWNCESTRGWAQKDPDNAIRITRAGDVVEARYRFIDTAFTLDKPRQIRFGLIATPTKPLSVDRLRWRIDYAGIVPPKGDVEPAKAFKDSRWPKAATAYESWRIVYKDQLGIDLLACLGMAYWAGYHVWHPHVTDPAVAAKLREDVSRCKAEGMVLALNGGWAVAPYAPEWDPWGKEMVALPRSPTFANQFMHTYSSPFVEFFIGSWALNARDYGVSGVRFDTISPWHETKTPWLGETWTSLDGKTYGTNAIYRQREMFKRLWRIFNGGEVKDGVVFNVAAGPPMMVVNSFADFYEIGEGFYMTALDLKAGYPQDSFRAWMRSEPYGVIVYNNMKGAPLMEMNRMGPILALGARPRMLARPPVWTSRYAAEKERIPVPQFWAAWSWVDFATAEFCPHWDNADKVSSTAQEGGQHYVSFQLQKGRRILLTVANYEKTAQNVRVEFKLGKLGFAPDAALQCRDVVTSERIPMERGAVTLKCEPELFRYVRIGTAEELDGPPIDPKHPMPPVWK